jgi:hypothetical protein
VIHRIDDELEIPSSDVTSFVFEHADEYPDRPAMVEGPSGRVLTYGELRRSRGLHAQRA